MDDHSRVLSQQSTRLRVKLKRAQSSLGSLIWTEFIYRLAVEVDVVAALAFHNKQKSR
jgi:hypothetical protein